MYRKPRIGITFDAEGPGGYSKFPWYALRENYCSSIVETGGIPLPLSHELSLVEEYLSLIDGLVVTGGDYDIPPSIYGASSSHPTVKIKPKRTDFEIALVKGALAKNLPILGICGGHQLINVVLGGTLIQHIPEEVPQSLQHEQGSSPTQSGHSLRVVKNTLLYRIVQTEELFVNSSHHQAVEKLAPHVTMNAVAPDGVIEGIEAPAYRFCLGLQWHPEFKVTHQDEAIFKAFLGTASA